MTRRLNLPMAGLDPAIHAFIAIQRVAERVVDGRIKSGHGDRAVAVIGY